MTEGSNLQLFCHAAGKPSPNITWVRVLQYGSESEVLHRGPTWNFLNIGEVEAGTYRCTAYNRVEDPVTHTLTVNVLCKYMQNFSWLLVSIAVWLNGFKGALHHFR